MFSPVLKFFGFSSANRSWVFILIALIAFSSCSGVGGLGGGIPGSNLNPATDDGGSDGSAPIQEPQAVPPSTPIPISALHSQALIAYACDSGSACPVTGTSEGSKVAFTQDAGVFAQYKQKYNSMLAFATRKPVDDTSSHRFSLKRILSSIIPNSIAQQFGPNINLADGGDLGAIPLCERPGVTCFDTVNGEFEAFPTGTNDTTFHYVATDGIRVLGDEQTTTPNKHMLYFMGQPQALTQGNLTPAGANIGEIKSSYASAGGFGKQVDFVKENNADPRIMVVGNYREKYNGFEAGNEMAFDSVNNLMSTDLLDGVGVFPLQNNSFMDVGAVASEEGIENYRHLKFTWDSTLRFIATPQANLDTSVKIYSVLAGINDVAQLLPGANRQNFSHIIFFAGQIDLRENFRDSIAYDVDSHGCGLLIFEDTDGNKRIRMACPENNNLNITYPEIDGGIINGANADTIFDELIIFDESLTAQDSPTTFAGKALLLSSNQKMAWQISYHNPQQRLRARDPAWIHADLVDANSIPMGAALKSFTITSDRKYLFAVNQDEDKVVAFKLKGEDNKALDIATIRNSKTDVTIKDKINWNPDNEGKIQPNALTIQKVDDTHEYLVVGSQALKGSVWFDVKPIKDQVTAKLQPAPVPAVNCSALMTQLSQTKDATLYLKLKTQYIAAECK